MTVAGTKFDGMSLEMLEERYNLALLKLGIHDESTAEQVLDHETAALFEEKSRLELNYPLAGVHLWRAPEAVWDQQRIAAALHEPLTLVLGGNRAGKTFAIMCCVVAYALGRDHPMIAAWLEDNDLDPMLVPLGPGEVYCVANSASGSIRYHRLDIEKLLPPGCHWRNKEALTEASVEIPVPGYETTARIWFKSVDQKHRAFKGDEVRFVAISEEPEGEEGKLVLAECLRACSSVGGRVVLEMTPQNGMTWVHDDLVEERQHDCQLIQIDCSLNSQMPDPASHARWLAGLTPEERAMRQYGQFTDKRGLVYTTWVRGDGSKLGPGHICVPFDIPREWPRYRAADWGQTKTNGTGVVWGAIGDDGTLYIYREYYLANEPSFRVHATNIRAKEPRDERVLRGWADHEQEAIDECALLGIRFEHADKDVFGGISRCAQRLNLVGGRPRLKVFSTCTRFVQEIEGYRRDPNKRDGSPVKKNDHIMDPWRYMENGLEAEHVIRADGRAVTRGLDAVLKNRAAAARRRQ